MKTIKILIDCGGRLRAIFFVAVQFTLKKMQVMHTE
jgi:hypothetical protein